MWVQTGIKDGGLGKIDGGQFTSTVTITSHRSHDDHFSCFLLFCSPRQLFDLLLCTPSTCLLQKFLLTTSQTYPWHWKPSRLHSRSQGCLSHLFMHPATTESLPLFPPCKYNHPEKASFFFPAPSSLSDLCLHPQVPSMDPLPYLTSGIEGFFHRPGKLCLRL